MPIKTRHFMLDAFLDGDLYYSILDAHRFQTVDNQLNVIGKIIGDGRISGWEIEDYSYPIVKVTKGMGIVDRFSVSTYGDRFFELDDSSKFYFYAQRREGIIGINGPRSDVVSIGYTDLDAPAAPVLTVTSSDGFQVDLSWTSNSEEDFSNYTVERSTDGVTYQLLLSTTSTSYSDTTVDEYTHYYYRLSAVDLSGNKASVVEEISTGVSSQLPPDATQVEIYAAEFGVNLLWMPPTVQGRYEIQHYLVTVTRLNSDSTPTDDIQTIIVNKDQLYEYITDLRTDSKYQVKLQIVDSQDRVSLGITKQATITTNPAPPDPTAIAYTERQGVPEGNLIDLVWTEGDSPYDPTDSYAFNIYVQVANGPWSKAINVPPTNDDSAWEETISIITYDDLNYYTIPENTLLTIRITSLAIGPKQKVYESLGTYIRFTSTQYTAPDPLQAMTSEFNPYNNTIVVKWDVRPTTDHVLMTVTEKEIGTSGSANEIVSEENIDLADKYVFSSISVGYRYEFYAYAVNSAGILSNAAVARESILAEETTEGLPRPPFPSMSIKIGDRYLTLEWEETDTESIDYYKLYRHEGDIIFVASQWNVIDTLDVGTVTFTDYGLDNDQIYSYYLTSVDIYGRESYHLPDNNLNLNYVSGAPKSQSPLIEPTDVALSITASNKVKIEWYSTLEEFDSFTVYRSVNNLHEWEQIATIERGTNPGPYSYTDVSIPLINGTTFYYTVDKTVDDAEIIVRTTSAGPENSLYLGFVTTGAGSITTINQESVRDILNLESPLQEWTNTALLLHNHKEIDPYDPDRIDLNANLIVTDWTTVNGKIWTTEEKNISGGSIYVVRVNERFPSVFYTVDIDSQQIIFSETIAPVDENGNVTGALPEVELRVLGISEVQGILESFRIQDLHARQIGYGNINKEQIPTINHDGRIFENLEPYTYLLERYNNNAYTLPEASTDDLKTFGTGTTFYSLISGDGDIETVLSWEQQDDRDLVGFNRPSYSDTTVWNLKQFSEEYSLSTNDVVNHFYFDTDMFWGSDSLNRLMTWDKTDGARDKTWDVMDYAVKDFTFDRIAQKLYVLLYISGSDYLGTMDLVSKKITILYEITVPSIISGFQVQFITAVIDGNTSLIYALNATGAFYFSADDPSNPTLLQSSYGYIEWGGFTSSEYDIDGAPANSRLIAGLGIGTKSLSFFDLSMNNTAITSATGSDFHECVSYDHSSNTIYTITTSGHFEKWTYSGSWGKTTVRTGVPFKRLVAPPRFASFYVSNPSSLSIGNYREFISDLYVRSIVELPEQSGLSSASLKVTAAINNPSVGGSPVVDLSIVEPYNANTIDISYSNIAYSDTVGDRRVSFQEWVSGESVLIDVTDLVELSRNQDQGSYIIFKFETSNSSNEYYSRVAQSPDTSSPAMLTYYTQDRAGVNSEPGGFQSSKSMMFHFEFEDTKPTRWVRLTSHNAPELPNPIIDLNKRLRFWILSTKGSLYLTLGIREIDGTGSVGEDGGTTGPIEWVAIDEFIEDGDNYAPRGVLIEPSNNWQSVDIDLRNANVRTFAGGDGQLKTGGYGVLEHLAFTINPDSDNPTGPFDVYIDNLQQVDDLMIAGTSRGIQVSTDFGSNWTVIRLTNNPVHKFYRSQNNFIWAITGNQVFVATDPLYWFPTNGLNGVQNIRDIAEDNAGNMYLSTDKGIYFFEIALLQRYAIWQQTAPTTPLSIDSYALYHTSDNKIWVSTELGIFETSDQGLTWTDTGINTAGYVAYKIQNIGTLSNPNLIAVTRKHVLRKLGSAASFEILTNLEEDHHVTQIWTFGYFEGRLYLSTEEGIFRSIGSQLFTPGIDLEFERSLPDADFKTDVGTVFDFNIVSSQGGSNHMFLGQENRLLSVSEDGKVTTRSQFFGTLPSFYKNGNKILNGYVYNNFNNVVNFREPLSVNDIISAAYLPRYSFIADNGGWAHVNPEAEFFIYFEGVPKWIYFDFDVTRTLSELDAFEEQISNMDALTDYNSQQPRSSEYLSSVQSDIGTLRSILQPSEDEEAPDISRADAIRSLIKNTSLLISSIDHSVITDANLSLPNIIYTGQDSANVGSRAATLVELEQYNFDSCEGIEVNATTGFVDFQDHDTYEFDKYDKLNISIFNTNIDGVGDYAHSEIEGFLEDKNTGLSAQLGRVHYANLIKTGITLEWKHNYLFDRYDISNVQSKFYASHTNDWYDQLNSTVDWRSVIKVSSLSNVRFVTSAHLFTEDPYFSVKIWAGTDNGVVQIDLTDDGEVEIEDILELPDGCNFVRDIYAQSDSQVYIVSEDSRRRSKIFKTTNYGHSWIEISTTNLPSRIYQFAILSGTPMVGTSEGVFYSDPTYLGWFRGDFTLSSSLGVSDSDFNSRQQSPCFNLSRSEFVIGEVGGMVFFSVQGIEYFVPRLLFATNATTGIRRINKMLRHRHNTYIATDYGLYNDGNSILSEQMATSLQYLESGSSTIEINDIVSGEWAIYAAGGNGKIYRFTNHEDYGGFNEWLQFSVPSFGPIHKMVLYENPIKHIMVVMSYDKIKAIDVTPSGAPDDDGDGIFRKPGT